MTWGRWWLILLAWGCGTLIATGAWAQEKPIGFIVDQADVLSREERRALNEKFRQISESDSVAVYFVSYDSLPERGVNDPVAKLPERWIGERLGAIFFYGADETRYVVTSSPGLIKALGTDRFQELGRAIEGASSQTTLVSALVAVADAILGKVREARVEAAGALPDRPMEWDPVGRSWEPLLASQEGQEDELPWATTLAEETDERSPEAIAVEESQGGEANVPWVPILGWVFVAGLGGFYLVKLLRHEKVLEKAYPVQPRKGRVEPRFGALASGGHGATVDLRRKDD